MGRPNAAHPDRRHRCCRQYRHDADGEDLHCLRLCRRRGPSRVTKAHSLHHMSAGDNPSLGPEPQITASLLQRLLSTVEDSARSRRLEIASAMLLGLATIASAWCGYQSTLWSGAQTFSLVAANEAARKSTQL